MRRGWQVACVCLLGIFIPALITSLGYSLTDALGPGPGFFPFWLSLIGIALTGTMLVQLARGRVFADAAAELLPDRQAALQAGAVLVALTVAAALLEPLGFRLTMLPFIAGLLLVLGARSPDRHCAHGDCGQLRRVPRLLLLAQGAAADRRARDLRGRPWTPCST